MLYPFVGAAIVTIAPFLFTFENGQDIVHGIFGFSALLLLLVFAWVNCRFGRMKIGFISLFSLLLFAVSVIDLGNILALQSKPLGLNVLVSLCASIMAVAMACQVKKMSFPMMNTIVFVSLGLHFFLLNFSYTQPLLEFPITKALDRSAQTLPRNKLPESFKQNFKWTESPMVTKDYVDTSKTMVVILVESWGIPIDTNLFRRELNVFQGVMTDYGAHHRMYSMTRTAEREDLADTVLKTEEKKDTVFIPQIYKENGCRSTFLVGADSMQHRRYKYIHNMGFTEVFFADSMTDSAMATKIDSLLQDTSGIQFIAWTTRDTKFPVQGDAEIVDSVYYGRLFNSLNMIKDLAVRHPNVRFVVQGDHEPLLAPNVFMEKFYRRWVPYVVLN